MGFAETPIGVPMASKTGGTTRRLIGPGVFGAQSAGLKYFKMKSFDLIKSKVRSEIDAKHTSLPRGGQGAMPPPQRPKGGAKVSYGPPKNEQILL